MTTHRARKARTAAPHTEDELLRELWAVKAALNKEADYDPRKLAARANKLTLASALRKAAARARLAA